jgi:hypothetical protein
LYTHTKKLPSCYYRKSRELLGAIDTSNDFMNRTTIIKEKQARLTNGMASYYKASAHLRKLLPKFQDGLHRIGEILYQLLIRQVINVLVKCKLVWSLWKSIWSFLKKLK